MSLPAHLEVAHLIVLIPPFVNRSRRLCPLPTCQLAAPLSANMTDGTETIKAAFQYNTEKRP